MSSTSRSNRPGREMMRRNENTDLLGEDEVEDQDVHPTEDTTIIDEEERVEQNQDQGSEEVGSDSTDDDNSDVVVPMVGSHPIPIDSDKKMVLKRSSSSPSMSSAASSTSLRALVAREPHEHQGVQEQEQVHGLEETTGAEDAGQEEGKEHGISTSNPQVAPSGIIEEKEEVASFLRFQSDNPHTFPPSFTAPVASSPFAAAAVPAVAPATTGIPSAVEAEAAMGMPKQLPSSRNTSRRYFQMTMAPLPASSTGEHSFSSLSDPFHNDQPDNVDTSQAGSRQDHPQYDSRSRMMSSHRGRGYRRSSSLPDYSTSNRDGDGNMDEEDGMEFLVPLELFRPAPGPTNISTTMVDSGEYETSTSAFFRRLLDDLRQQQEERLDDADSDSPRGILEGGSAHSATSMASGASGASSHADSRSSLNLLQIVSDPAKVHYRSHTAAMVGSLMLPGIDERPYHPMDDYFVYMLRRREVETHNVQLVYDRARTHGLPPSEEEEDEEELTEPTLSVQLVCDRARTHGLPPTEEEEEEEEEEEVQAEASTSVATVPTFYSSPPRRRQKALTATTYTSSPPPASPAASVASMSSIGEDILGGHESYDFTASTQLYESVDVSNQPLSPMNEDSPDNVMDARLGVSSMMTKPSQKDQPNKDTQRKQPSSTKISSILHLDEDDVNEEDEEDYDVGDFNSAVKRGEGGRPQTIQEEKSVSVASLLPMIDALADEDEEC